MVGRVTESGKMRRGLCREIRSVFSVIWPVQPGWPCLSLALATFLGWRCRRRCRQPLSLGTMGDEPWSRMRPSLRPQGPACPRLAHRCRPGSGAPGFSARPLITSKEGRLNSAPAIEPSSQAAESAREEQPNAGDALSGSGEATPGARAGQAVQLSAANGPPAAGLHQRPRVRGEAAVPPPRRRLRSARRTEGRTPPINQSQVTT